ncbi:phage major capsid protein [Tunturiibacter gelidoferens]|uniref:HK97 family phage major capsid protein n=1 Tax=Tunturiibacter gelidiferens TaxID=3069689 RepID=A0A9X0U7V3_9BACT|nr:phage major capsid protein [Edaphobacter lichenicola]MBB5331387.1 HK97 family phage major capsid protein [Edaphobacter lichenicola]
MDPNIKSVLDSIKGSVEAYGPKIAAIQTQLDAQDRNFASKIFGDSTPPAFVEKLKSHEGFQRLLNDRRGKAVLTLTGKDASDFLSRKTTITETGQGFQTTGVLAIDRDTGITAEARQTLTVRDALTSRPTSFAVVDFVKVTTPMGIASPVPEASVKPENAVVFTSESEKVRTIATWIPASRQILDDFTELASFLQTSLAYYVNLEEELQLLAGDDTGENLHGLIPQASAFQTGLLSLTAGFNRIDIIGRAIEQLTTAKEIPPTFVVMHPADWWSIRLTKDSFGRYLIGDPQATANARLFDLLVIPTTSIPVGVFLVGSGNPAACEIRDRMELQFEVSTEHASYFTSNLCACRAEKRMVLITKRPGSFVTGTFITSPVS